MKHVNFPLDEEFVIFEKYGLSPNELFFVQMLLLSQEEDVQDTIRRYFKLPEKSRGSIIDTLHSLQDKGIILKDYKVPNKGETFNPLDVPLNKNFVNACYKSSYDMFRELYDHYPTSTVVNGIEYKLRRISKKFNSLEDAGRYYGKCIRWNPELHAHIIELVDRAKDAKYNFTTLDDFIVDNDWNNIEEINDSGILNTSQLKQL